MCITWLITCYYICVYEKPHLSVWRRAHTHMSQSDIMHVWYLCVTRALTSSAQHNKLQAIVPMSKHAICSTVDSIHTQCIQLHSTVTQHSSQCVNVNQPKYSAVIRPVWEQISPECHRNVLMSFWIGFYTQRADIYSVGLPTSLSCYSSLPHALFHRSLTLFPSPVCTDQSVPSSQVRGGWVGAASI